jgi:hypothetical protein
MRFFRVSYWFAFLVFLALSGWLCLCPELARQQLGDSTSLVPLIYLQEHGLFLFMQACAFAYVAERPAKSIPVVALACIVNASLPLFAISAYYRNEIGQRHFVFQMAASCVLLPFLGAYIAWFYHVPRPNRFMPLLGLFGDRK